ncbi:helix-turn-helix transcriptional regulator [Rossellomorea oryzaecorticis]|uniref:Helix-turn-helix transcriptional regulator n=1 Tax=Rossellomorea oryzaecorticis TaxID=1396505 RepID=A0ABU9K3V1_9BACI
MNRLGERVKAYRERKGFTRKKLAEDLCDESTIFRLEKSKQLPRLEILNGIAEKLDIPLHTLLFPHDRDLIRLKKLCRELTYFEDYAVLEMALEEIEKIFEFDISYTARDTKKFIDWHKAIIIHKVHKRYLEAIELLESLVDIEYAINEIDIGILNSIGLIYLDLNRYEEARHYTRHAFEKLKEIPTLVEDLTLFPRVGYNYAYILYYLEFMDEAIEIAYELLYYLKAHHLNYCLGEILHLIATVLKRKGKNQEALNYLKKASYAFKLEDSCENILIVENNIKELECIHKAELS